MDNLALENLELIERFALRYSLGYERGDGSNHFLRVKVPNGFLTSKQFRGIAKLSERYGRGYAEVTDRQSIQLHWVREEDALDAFTRLEELGFTTDKCGQAYPGARYGDVRSIIGCPVAGVDRDELIDASPILKELTSFFTGKREYLDLPRKFKISISGCAINCHKPEVQDLGFVAVKRSDEEVGFTPLVGGSNFSTMNPPIFAKPMGVSIRPKDILAFTKAIVEVYRDHGSRETKARARFKWLVEAWGIGRLRAALEEKLGWRLEDGEFSYQEVSGLEHVGVQEQKQGGYSYICVPVLTGALTSKQMFQVADLADRYGSGEIRTTNFQNLVIINVEDEAVPRLLEGLESIGLPVRGSKSRWMTIACSGNFCGKSPDNTKRRTVEIVNHLESRLGEAFDRLSLRLSISGCPNSCGQHPLADVGLQAVGVRGDSGGLRPAYNLYLGGSLGPIPKAGRLVRRSVEAEDIGVTLENLLRRYLEETGGRVSFGEFCDQRSLDELGSLSGLKGRTGGGSLTCPPH